MSTEIDAALWEKLTADPLAGLLGVRYDSIRPGYVKASLTVTPSMMNAAGTLHGGTLMAVVDIVHAAVSNSHGIKAVAQDVHTEFLNPGAVGDELVCEGTEVHCSRRTAVYRIDITAQPRDGRDGRLLATALARVFRLGTPWLE